MEEGEATVGHVGQGRKLSLPIWEWVPWGGRECEQMSPLLIN